MPRGKRLSKESPEAAVTNMPSTERSNETFGLHAPSTESMDSEGMGGLGSPTAMKSNQTSSSGAGGPEKPHSDHAHNPHHHKAFEDPQGHGHDLRHPHGYNLRVTK